MVGPTRSKLKEAASQPLHSSGSVQCRRRRRITGAGEPETEEEPQGEVEKSELPLPVGRRNLPGGARPCSPRRTRNLNAQKCMQMDMVTKALFLRRFQFLTCYLEQLLNKLHVLRRRQFSSRATICIGEQNRPERGVPTTLRALGVKWFGCVLRIRLASKPSAIMTRSKLWKLADKNSQPS